MRHVTQDVEVVAEVVGVEDGMEDVVGTEEVVDMAGAEEGVVGVEEVVGGEVEAVVKKFPNWSKIYKLFNLYIIYERR